MFVASVALGISSIPVAVVPGFNCTEHMPGFLGDGHKWPFFEHFWHIQLNWWMILVLLDRYFAGDSDFHLEIS